MPPNQPQNRYGAPDDYTPSLSRQPRGERGILQSQRNAGTPNRNVTSAGSPLNLNRPTPQNGGEIRGQQRAVMRHGQLTPGDTPTTRDRRPAGNVRTPQDQSTRQTPNGRLNPATSPFNANSALRGNENVTYNRNNRPGAGNTPATPANQVVYPANARQPLPSSDRGRRGNLNRVTPDNGTAPPTPNPDQVVQQPVAGDIITSDTTSYIVIRVLQDARPPQLGMSDGVRLVRHPTGRLFEAKRLRTISTRQIERAEGERKALQQIVNAGGHLNVNSLFEAFRGPSKDRVNLVMEHCDGVALHEYLDGKARSSRITPENFCWHILSSLASALAMCHYGLRDALKPESKVLNRNTICHLDIKPANVFMSSTQAPGHLNEQFPRIILGDFGCSVTRDDYNAKKVDTRKQPFGTPGWYAPENDPDKDIYILPYGSNTDVWQMGGVIQAITRLIVNPNLALAEEKRACGSNYSTELNMLVSRCMARDVPKRPSSDEVAKAANSQMIKRGMMR